MINHPPYSMVLTYIEDPKQLIMQAVNSARLAPAVRGIMEVPFFLDDEKFKLDDEFARRLGVAMLNLIGPGQPEINQYMSVTQEPIERPSGQ